MTTNPDFDIPQLPVPPEEDPISELLGTRVVDMTDEELDAYTKDMRTAIQSPQTLKALMRNGGDGTTKAKKARKVQVNKVLDLFKDL